MCYNSSEPSHVWRLHSASEYLKRCYVDTRFITAQEEWPPDQPKYFTSVALICCKDGRTKREAIAIFKKIHNYTVDEIMNMFPLQNVSSEEEQSQEQVKTTKNVKDIFAPDEDGQEPCRILIEGAPGIGKTVLSKEIAYQWANGLLLVNMVLLFLIFLRDPLVQRIESLKDLVKYYYQFDERGDSIASSCADYLFHSDGEHVTFVFDGYDEFPESLRQNGFISDILHRKRLLRCHLVVTSRPHASAHLRTNCDRFIQILGFTEEDKQNYIISSLKKKQDVDELVEYLDNHLTISSLCFIPFNMTVLLWLYKQESALPNNSVQLYNYFICHTIRHYLAKYQISLLESFIDLNTLEEPYKKVIQQLSFLSYQALNKSQLTFTLDEIRAACPQIDEIPEALNGFGLLQAVQHFGFKNTTTLNFVHFTVQEFLAAHHITCLSHYKEFCVIKEKFMSNFYANTFTMYVGMTKGKRPAFKQYLGGNGKQTAYMYGIFGRFTPVEILSPSVATYPGSPLNARLWLRLFKCFYEADDKASCREMTEAIFYYLKGNVILSEILLRDDVECLGLFLCSRKEWKGLYLHQSFDDASAGMQILHQLLTTKATSTCIHTIYIGSNLCSLLRDGTLTQSSSCLITDIARSCKTKVSEVFGPLLLLNDVVLLKYQLKKLIFYVEKSQTEDILVCLKDDEILKVLKFYEEHPSDSGEVFIEAIRHNNINECSSVRVKCMKLYRIMKIGTLKGVAKLRYIFKFPLFFIYYIHLFVMLYFLAISIRNCFLYS